jgi:hypothetical protein
MIPALAGLVIGVLVIVRRLAHRRVEWFFLTVGCAACGFLMFSWTFLN